MREIVSPLSGIRSPFKARRNPLAAYRSGGVLNENGNWNDTGAWSGSEDFDGTSGADLRVEINDWLMTQDTVDSRLHALEA